MQTGHDSTTVSTVDTQYAPCACSPLGKLWRVSQPYAPGGTEVWTTYTYDARGRTLTVTAPDGSVTSTVYQGNQTTVTDAAGKWKTSIADAFGNLTVLIEPNLATNYTYNRANQLTQVSMPRSTGTQTRTFAYTGADLTSATNPENGTVTYTYDGAHHVVTRTDTKGQQTQYDHDTYGRVSEVRHYIRVSGALQEDPNQRVDYSYDTVGRLGSTTFGGNDVATWGLPAPRSFGYWYSYNQAGRVTSQTMSTNMALVGGDSSPMTLNATYTWDNEGKMTSMQGPVLNGMSSPSLGPYQYQYDAMGRLNGLLQNQCTWFDEYGNCGVWAPQTQATAAFGPAQRVEPRWATARRARLGFRRHGRTTACCN